MEGRIHGSNYGVLTKQGARKYQGRFPTRSTRGIAEQANAIKKEVKKIKTYRRGTGGGPPIEDRDLEEAMALMEASDTRGIELYESSKENTQLPHSSSSCMISPRQSPNDAVLSSPTPRTRLMKSILEHAESIRERQKRDLEQHRSEMQQIIDRHAVEMKETGQQILLFRQELAIVLDGLAKRRLNEDPIN
jgi:hypothetical protein